MHGLLRRLPLVALSATLLGGTLAPAMAQAAPPLRAQPKTVQWSSAVIERSVTAGSFHRLGVATRFYTPAKLQHTVFTIRFNGGLYAAPTSTGLGTVGRGTHDLAFTVAVPARTRTGSYLGTGRLFHLQGRHAVQSGANLYVIVRVAGAGAPHPGPHPRPRPRPIAPIVRWQPANSLGAIAVQRGQTVTETVSFTSNVALTGARVARDLGDNAQDRGVRVRVVSPVAPTSVLTGTAVPVVFTISATRAARLGAYPADLHVDAATADRRYARLPYDLDFRVRVTDVLPVIHWQPSSNFGAIAVQRGQTVTETSSFTSSVDLTDVRLMRDLGDVARDHGVVVQVVSPTTLPSLAANTPVSVTFAVAARSAARLGSYPAALYVAGTEASGPRATFHYGLHFVVRVHQVAPAIHWQPLDNLGGITVQRGQTVTETAAFTSNVDLSNAEIRRSLSDAAGDAGVGVAVVSPLGPQSVAANTPVSVTFTLAARPSARVGDYPAYLYVIGTEPGGPRAILHYGLHFVIRVRHIAPVIHWQPRDSLGAITVQRGQTVTETVSFSSNVALTSAEVRSVFNDTARDRGVVIAVLAPSTFPSVDAGAAVPVTFTISAKPGARLGGYADALYVKASELGEPAVRLPYSLRYSIDVDQAPATTVAWTGGNYVTFPAVARGQIVTETATFTTSADVANAVVRLSGVQRSRGLRVRLIPLNGAEPATPVSIAANMPTTVSLVVDASKMAAPGFFSGDVFLYAQPAGAPSRQLLHNGLHFTGAVQ